MNELATGLLLTLARTTAILAAAAVAVCWLLRVTRASSPVVHRAAWCLVLLQGWLWFRVPLEIPWYEAVGPAVGPALPVESAAVGPALPAESESAATPADRAGPTDVPAGKVAEGPALPADLAGGSPRDPQPGHGVTGLLSTPAESKPVNENAIPAHTAGPSEAAQPLWPVILTAVWFAGMGLLVAGWLGCYLVFLSLLPRGQRADKAWVDQWEELLRSRGIRGAIPMRVTVRTGPVLCRLPRGYQLLVPAALWERLDPAGRLSILRHELAHLERGDVWKSLWVRLLALPHWFNPLAWWAVRRFDEAAEWACDQQVCDTGPQARPEYAKALVVLGESAAPELFRPAARGRRLSHRIRRLLDSDPKEDSLMKKLLVLGVALALALVCLIRFDLVAKEPAAESVAGVGPAPPAASQPAAIPAGKPGATDTNRVPPYMLTYDGKSFQRWLDEFRTELNPVRRTEAVKALAAFGARGYGKEATEAIVTAMREYWVDYLTGSPIDRFKSAALHAFSTEGSSGKSAPVIDPDSAVPVLIGEIQEGPPNGRHFAALVLRDIGPQAKAASPVLAQVVRNDTDPRIRRSAFRALASVDRSGETTMSLVAELARGKDRRLAVEAVGAAAAYAPGGRGARPKRPGPWEPSDLPDNLKPFVKMVIEGVTDKDPELRHDALGALWEMGAAAAKDAVPALINLLEKGNAADCELVLPILDHLSPEAGKALVPALRKAARAFLESGNGFLQGRLTSAAQRIEGAPSRFRGGPALGDMTPDPRGAAKGPSGSPAAKTPGTPGAPSGKAASEEKKAEPQR